MRTGAGAGLRPPARGGAHPRPSRGPQAWAARLRSRPTPAGSAGRSPPPPPAPLRRSPPPPPGRQWRTRCGLVHAARGLAPPRPPAPPSPASLAFTPALVRDSVSFVKVRSPDRLLGAAEAAVLKGSRSRSLSIPDPPPGF